MGVQLRLVLLLLISLIVLHVVRASMPHAALKIVHDDPKDNELDSEEEFPLPLQKTANSISISTPKVKEAKPLDEAKKISIASTLKPVSDEVLKDLIEASKHSAVLADDPRFNKMLPEKLKQDKSSESKHNKSDVEYYYYDYNDDYDEEYDIYDETTSAEPTKKIRVTTPKPMKKLSYKDKTVEMKPIKEDNKKPSKAMKMSFKNDIVHLDSLENNETNKLDDKHPDNAETINDAIVFNNEDDDDDDDDENDDDDDDDGIEDDIVFSENVPCPRYCVCARNINSFLVATCSRIDSGTQKFGADITDLIVTDAGPKYPILLGPKFFYEMGLRHVSSIKISNCSIEYLHPEAFHGLDDLYSVNLTNVGLAIINPDTFVQNKKLRLLTLSGNDFSVLYNLHYILKSSTIEELDLSHNNLGELNIKAFSQLTNIIYINLSHNNLQKIPEHVFDTVKSLEELDLSDNALQSLPAGIFNRTSLAILHLRSNAFTNDLSFGTKDLQQLDLSYNSIHSVHHNMFYNMTALTNLNLRGNGITKISPDSFLTLHELRHIDLSFNELDQVSSLLFYKNSELDVIRLNDNPRLTNLPTDGFVCRSGYFTAYFLDISNCAIGALGRNTFATMPHLASLKLSWNNINNLENDTFAKLTKLNDLDLSNNLITRLDNYMFINNNALTKLNLSGNTMHNLSIRLFRPLYNLAELDVSDCELTTLLTDNNKLNASEYKFFEKLHSFNASANQIKDISSKDIRNFKNLRTFDISRNPLKCNENFQDFISYVSLNKIISPNARPLLMNIINEGNAGLEELEAHRDWAKLALEVCKHQENFNYKTKDTKDKDLVDIEHRLKESDIELNEDDLLLLNMIEKGKSDKIKHILRGTSKSNKRQEIVAHHEEDVEKDDDDENESDYEEDDDDDDEEYDDDDVYDNFDKQLHAHETPKIIDHGIKVEEIDLRTETKDKFLLNKFLTNGDKKPTQKETDEINNNNAIHIIEDDVNDDDENDYDDADDEEIIIERGRIYYGGYQFILPIIVIITGVLALLLILAKIVSLVMRKRGERYRMALLAASKNSIVYQKLTEDIKPPAKEAKQPKVHRYSPINQV